MAFFDYTFYFTFLPSKDFFFYFRENEKIVEKQIRVKRRKNIILFKRKGEYIFYKKKYATGTQCLVPRPRSCYLDHPVSKIYQTKEGKTSEEKWER